jgi:hypothetical protein
MLQFFLFILSFSYITWDIMYVYNEAAVTCKGDLLGIGGFQDVVMANMLGSGCLQDKVSSRNDTFPPWD